MRIFNESKPSDKLTTAADGVYAYCMLMHVQQQDPVQPEHCRSSEWRDGNCRLPAVIVDSLTKPAPSTYRSPGASRLTVVFAQLLYV